MDTTLRDGEQTSGMSFSSTEKLTITKLLLEELNIDRIEVASARVSEGEFQAVQNITNWAKKNGYLGKIEILTFLDNGVSLKWLIKSGAKVQNLLTKGSLNHLIYQIKKSPEEYFKMVSKSILNAQKEGVITNVYLEDWSNGMRNSKEYVYKYLKFLNTLPIKRILLPDTLGILNPKETYTPKITSSKISKTSFVPDNMHPQILSLDTNEPINIDTKQVYVNYFINKNWNNLNNYLPFYEIELLEDDGESEYENTLCDY